MNEVYITAEGLEQMREELNERINVKRMVIADRLDKAIKMGDLKENADYHVAKEDQAFNEGRIKQLQVAISDAKVIRENVKSDRVSLGNKVVIAEVGFEDEAEEYRIVGAREADPANGRISNESPIGLAVLGAKIGQIVTAQTPGGPVQFKILRLN